MGAYILKRLLLMIPTLLGIMLVSFVIIQFAPGGPVERVLAQLQGTDVGGTARIGGSSGGEVGAGTQPGAGAGGGGSTLSLIHISEPTRPPLLSRMPSSA